MWTYNKVLQYPINIKNPNAKLAKFIISQYGGPDGELAASLRYLSQRFGMPDQKAKATLNDIGTEELAHLEMVGTIVHQLTRGLCPDEIKAAGLGDFSCRSRTLPPPHHPANLRIHPDAPPGAPLRSKGPMLSECSEYS